MKIPVERTSADGAFAREEQETIVDLLLQVGMRVFLERYPAFLESRFEPIAGVSPFSSQNRLVAAKTIFRRGWHIEALRIIALYSRDLRLADNARELYLLQTGIFLEKRNKTMFSFPIGVMLDSFRTDTFTAIRQAAKLGAVGVQMYATAGENAPEAMSASRKHEILSAMRDNGLVFSALCGDLGCGFTDPARNPGLIERSKRILELAKELGADIVTTHIGVVPADPSHERYKIMQEACRTLAEYADGLGAHFAIETGPETAVVLKGFLDSLDSCGVAVNLDPANFVMVTGDDPVQAVYTLQKYIVHTHAKDGVKLFDKDPEMVYHLVADALAHLGSAFQEVPLGQGKVDFPRYLSALDEIGYRGFLTVEREVGEDPEKDIGEAVGFLKEIIARA